jgi:hypothetical protein
MAANSSERWGVRSNIGTCNQRSCGSRSPVFSITSSRCPSVAPFYA